MSRNAVNSERRSLWGYSAVFWSDGMLVSASSGRTSDQSVPSENIQRSFCSSVPPCSPRTPRGHLLVVEAVDRQRPHPPVAEHGRGVGSGELGHLGDRAGLIVVVEQRAQLLDRVGRGRALAHDHRRDRRVASRALEREHAGGIARAWSASATGRVPAGPR